MNDKVAAADRSRTGLANPASLANMAMGAFFLLASALWCYVAGKDLNWDFFNYHLYGPHLLLEGRFDNDYFGGSIPGYLNPLVYVPLYLMVRAEWHSLVIAGILTLFHSINLLLAWRICDRLLPHSQPHRRWYLFCGVLLAFLTPLFLAELGTSFADLLTSIPVLAGLGLMLGEVAKESWSGKKLGAAGLLLGVATGLKLTNGLFAVGAALALTLTAARKRGLAAGLSFLMVGGLAGALLAHGYWSAMLWREFGNPLFPIANNLFRAEDFPAVMFQDRRFLLTGILDSLTLPLSMMGHRSGIYAEIVAPDIGPLALFVLLAAALLFRRWRRRHAAMGIMPGTSRGLELVTAFFIASYLLWLVSSSIGRYAMPLWLLAGPLIAAWIPRLVTPDRGLLVLVLLCLVQGVQVYSAENLRWSPVHWDRQWLDVRVPDRLREAPYLFISLGLQSWSAIVPYLHPDASFANVVGQYVIPGGDKTPRRLRSLLDRFGGRTKVVFGYREDHMTNGALGDNIAADVNAMLSTYDLQLESEPGCEVVEIRFDAFQKWVFSAASREREKADRARGRQLLVCAIRRGRSAAMARTGDAETKRIEMAFASVEKACPILLSPPGGQVIRGRRGWQRMYFNTVNTLMTNGNNMSIKPYSSMTDIDLGRVESWLAGRPPYQCEGQIVKPSIP